MKAINVQLRTGRKTQIPVPLIYRWGYSMLNLFHLWSPRSQVMLSLPSLIYEHPDVWYRSYSNYHSRELFFHSISPYLHNNNCVWFLGTSLHLLNIKIWLFNKKVFNKKQAAWLLRHQLWDCETNLLPRATPHWNCIYPISIALKAIDRTSRKLWIRYLGLAHGR